MIDIGLRRGPYGSGFWPFGSGLNVKKLLAAPHGLDLGPLKPCLPERLKTPSKRIELAPRPFLDDLARLKSAAEIPSAENGKKFLLIGRRHVRSNNSWMHNIPRLMKGRERCTLLMHPIDATRVGLKDGEPADVVSDAGRIRVPVETSEEMMQGVVSLPHGWGHDKPGVRMATAAARPGASYNDLVGVSRIDALAGTAAFSGVHVQVFPEQPRS